MRGLLVLAFVVPIPGEIAPAEAPPPNEQGSELNSSRTEQPADTATLRLVWDAGLAPVAPEDYLQALRARLPPGRFDDAADGDRAWIVTVSQPQPGIYRLVIAPPDRKPLARRRIDLPDPDEARRTLALLTVFALENGEFPPLSDGVTEEESESGEEPDAEAQPEPPPPAERPPGSEAPPPDPRWRLIGHVGGGPWLAAPTTRESDPVVIAGAAAFDVGLTYRKWLWAGVESAYSGFPGSEVDAHGVVARGFAGIHPRLGPGGGLQPGARLGVGAGILHGRGVGQSATRPFFSGSAAGGLDWNPRRVPALLLGIWLSLEAASRASTFEAVGGDAIGIGHVRGGAFFTMGWSVVLDRPQPR